MCAVNTCIVGKTEGHGKTSSFEPKSILTIKY